MPTEYTVEIAGKEYPWVDIRYVRDYKFYGKTIEVIIPEWIVEIAGDDIIVIKRDGATVTSGTIKKIMPFEGVGKGMGMTVGGYTKEMKHATLLTNARTYNADPHDIIIDDLGSSDLTDGTTNPYGSNIVVEFGSNDESKFSRKQVYEEVAFITGWELYVNPTGALDFKSQCGVDRSSGSGRVFFKHGELLESWYKPHMVNYLVLKTKVIVLGAYEEDFEFYGVAGTGTNVLTVERKNLIDDNTCGLASAALYADMQNALLVGSIDVIDTYEGAAYDVYDTVRVEDARFDLAANVRIYRIERHVDKDGEHTRIFYTNITKLTSNGRYLLDLSKEYLGKGQRVLRDFGRTAVNVIDLRALDSAGKVDFSVIYVTNKGHTYLDGISTGQHHGMSHASRHETIGGADDLDTVSDGSHIHNLTGGTMNVCTGVSYETYYAANTPGGDPTWPFLALISIGWYNNAYILSDSQAVSGGAHTHNVTSSPTPDVMDAEDENDTMLKIMEDRLLPDGRRRVKWFFPEFQQTFDATYPVGRADGQVMKDIKWHYHEIWEAEKLGKFKTSKVLNFDGKGLKWDREKEKAYMDAKLAKAGDEERQENERKRLGRIAEELEREKK